MFASYFQSVRPDVRHVFSHYRLIDSAIKVVGVGSVGTRCAISLFFGKHTDDLLVLQGKEAMPSVLAPHLTTSSVDHQGQRVVLGQRVMQTASDFFLGGSKNPDGDHSYIRHFRYWKGSVDVACLDAKGLSDYGELCGDFQGRCHSLAATQAACIKDSAWIGSGSSGGLLIHTSSGWRQQRVDRLQRVGFARRAVS